MVHEYEPLLPSARNQVENLVVQFTGCTFTYTEAQIPRVGGGTRAGAESGTAAPSGSTRSPSVWRNLKDTAKNKLEKGVRRIEGALSDNDVGRRYDSACVFRPGDKIAVQNYVSSLKLRCKISFVGCTFEYREPTLCERISTFLLNCCGFLVERDPWTGREEIADETFRIDEIPGIIDKRILNIQQNAGAGASGLIV